MNKLLFTLLLALLGALAPLAQADHPEPFCDLEYYDRYGRPVYHGYYWPRWSDHNGYHRHYRAAAPRYSYEDDYPRRSERVVVIERDRDEDRDKKKKKKKDEDRDDPPGPHRILRRLFE